MGSPILIVVGLSGALALAGGTPAQEDEHAHHRARTQKAYISSRASYGAPAVTLKDHEGRSVAFDQEMAGSEPVALNFIFTTCSTICPVMTATLAKMREELGPDASGLRFISISIDPEYDTPQVLKSYAARYGADQRWQFLTGEMGEIVSVLKAFDAYAGSKTNHRPVTFLRAPSGTDWLRIEGLASGADLAEEYRRLLQAR
jgi:protein SCO1/2